MHALARDPLFRPDSAAQLALELASSTEQTARPLPQRSSVSAAGRSGLLWLTAAILGAVIALALGLARLGGNDSSPPPQPAQVTSPARGQNATQQARNLARWLRTHSR